jgi:hypothetical protein
VPFEGTASAIPPPPRGIHRIRRDWHISQNLLIPPAAALAITALVRRRPVDAT